ncbi:hypothetical protein SFUMM280S_10309 [Streptomyces fumanus]
MPSGRARARSATLYGVFAPAAYCQMVPDRSESTLGLQPPFFSSLQNMRTSQYRSGWGSAAEELALGVRMVLGPTARSRNWGHSRWSRRWCTAVTRWLPLISRSIRSQGVQRAPLTWRRW